jgi:hypothetical protein
MIIKSTLLAVIVFVGSLTVANAQTFVNGGVAGPFTTLGWNYGHLANCYTQVDGSITWFYAYIQEGGFGFTNNPAFAITLSPACQTGNFVGVFVTNLNPLRWTQVVTFTFK